MSQVATLGWFARHELRLMWRDWSGFLYDRRWLKKAAIIVGLMVLAAGMHFVVYALVRNHFASDMILNKAVLVMLMGGITLSFTMMMSQSLESVTRAFMTRDDFDLLLSSPAPAHQLFAIRLSMLALTNALMMALMVAPFVNVAVCLGGAQWLAGYAVVVALSAAATGIGVLTTIALFRTVGPKRTRLISQILAAVVGASLIVCIQVVTILSYGTMKRWSIMNSDSVASVAPAADSPVWFVAWAASGEMSALAMLVAISAAAFGIAVWVGATQFADIVVAASVETDKSRNRVVTRQLFKPTSLSSVLLQKEWTLLWRDPWLISQSLMQILYLVPPVVMLWVSFGDRPELAAVLAPVVVMAVGQLAGGLSWLSISGEDAHDLVATAPISPLQLMLAKTIAVLAVVLTVSAPIVLALALLTVWGAFVTLVCIFVASTCAITIQMWFRSESRRSMFRRRRSASKASTICEAFASILCSAMAVMAATGNPAVVVALVLLAIVMGVAWMLSPPREA